MLVLYVKSIIACSKIQSNNRYRLSYYYTNVYCIQSLTKVKYRTLRCTLNKWKQPRAWSPLWLWCGWATARDGSKLGFGANPLLEIEQLSQDKNLIFTISSSHLSNPRVHFRASASPVCTRRGRAWCWKDSSARFSTTLNDSIRPIWRSGARAGRCLPDTRWETSQLTARWDFYFFKIQFFPAKRSFGSKSRIGEHIFGNTL